MDAAQRLARVVVNWHVKIGSPMARERWAREVPHRQEEYSALVSSLHAAALEERLSPEVVAAAQLEGLLRHFGEQIVSNDLLPRDEEFCDLWVGDREPTLFELATAIARLLESGNTKIGLPEGWQHKALRLRPGRRRVHASGPEWLGTVANEYRKALSQLDELGLGG